MRKFVTLILKSYALHFLKCNQLLRNFSYYFEFPLTAIGNVLFLIDLITPNLQIGHKNYNYLKTSIFQD